MRVRVVLGTLLSVMAVVTGSASAHGRGAGHSLRAAETDQNFYFVMADRFENGSSANDHGGIAGGKAQDGFDPTGKGWYHGGDLQGIRKRLDYIQGLGTTAIWLTPSFKNKAVQPEDNSAGYHGYWITDFTQIDPHLGTNADLAALIKDAHARGMKVYFDIITNHTADVIKYREGDRPAYVAKDAEPYRRAGSGTPFDDRDFAGGSTFPALDAQTSFPYTPFNPPGSENLKVPSWLNDVTLYHNRGNTTFTGEDSQYGDFFGLDDLFTENPRVVKGFEDVYETWIRDFGVDGFRIDTMKHVDDQFWQRFLPSVLSYAHRHGKRDFFMFGEVFDTSRPYTSHFTTHDRSQAVLDFPFQAAAQAFAAGGAKTDALRDFFRDDDWYTDADSNAYELPTFLGNHDMGRIGKFVRDANPGATDAEVLSRDRLAHQLMYLSRGNPVVYYGDEQGFVGDGGDQDARQDMFPSQVASYNDDDLIGTDATTAQANFDTGHPLYTSVRELARLAARHPALRDGAQQTRWSTDGPGIFAFSRSDRGQGHEYVVALNNAESPRTAAVPTYIADGRFTRIYGTGDDRLRSDAARRLTVTVPALSAVVYESSDRIPRSHRAPPVSLTAPATGRDRVPVEAGVAGDGFAEVTFLARTGRGGWRSIGTDDNAPYRVFDDVADVAPGTKVRYRAVVLDNAGHRRHSEREATVVAPPAITIDAPAEGAKVRTAQLRATVVPEQASHVVTFERSTGASGWTPIGTDDSSPVYSASDDVTALGLATGTEVHYRAVLRYAPGRTVTSAVRTVTVAPPPLTEAVIHYQRADGDYTGWGLHLWGDAIADGVATDWGAPRPPDTTGSSGAVFRIPLKDDTKPVNFIVHQPGGDNVPTTREPGGDRSFVPADHPEIWLKDNDPNVYFAPPG
jgi:glycosidase